MKSVLALAVAVPIAAQAPPPFREYRIEAAHSSVAFDIGFLGHPVHGRFDDVRGTIVYRPSDLTASSVTVVIPTASINTGSKHRDEHLRSSDFFDAAANPTIVFTSRSVKQSKNGFVVTGPLTMHGVTRDVSIPFREMGPPVADPHGSSLVYFSGAFPLSRRDFGVAGGSKYNDWFDELRQRALSDTVNISIDVQGWDTDYDRTPRWKDAVDKLVADGVGKRVSALRDLAAQHPDTLRGAEWELDQAARALLQRGRAGDALAVFRLNADLFSKSALAQAELSRGYEALNDTLNAVASARRALAIDPGESQAIEVLRRVAGAAVPRAP
jgi:polyisoprenoid-binding protein YceI